MPLSHKDMVEALASDLSDQPFSVTILPGRAWQDRPISDAHGSQRCACASLDEVFGGHSDPSSRSQRLMQRPEAANWTDADDRSRLSRD